MASSSLLSSCCACLVLLFALSTAYAAAARIHTALFSTSSLALAHLTQSEQRAKSHIEQAPDKMHRNNNALLISKALMEEEEQEGTASVIRSTPARRPMPTYKENSAPTPLPEFPTLGPPIVWSFPATPLPALEAPPPHDMPALPRTGSKHGGPPPACKGEWDHHGHGNSRIPPSVPYVAAEPAVWPGPLEAPEGAPEPTAGGPLLPPYHH